MIIRKCTFRKKEKNYSTSINIKNKEKRMYKKVVKPCTMVLKFSKNTSAKKFRQYIPLLS